MDSHEELKTKDNVVVDGLIPPAVPSSEKLISCGSDQKRFLMMNKVVLNLLTVVKDEKVPNNGEQQPGDEK
jgi:hypothetical protein